MMHLVDVECMFDNQKIIFYFTADGRLIFVIWLKIWQVYFRQESNCVKLRKR